MPNLYMCFFFPFHGIMIDFIILSSQFTIIMCLALFLIMLLHYFGNIVLVPSAAAQLFDIYSSGGYFALWAAVFPVCKLSPRTTPPLLSVVARRPYYLATFSQWFYYKKNPPTTLIAIFMYVFYLFVQIVSQWNMLN